MANKTDEYLAIMLEGFENNLKNIDEYVGQIEPQLEAAKSQRENYVAQIKDLKVLLNIEAEEATLTLVQE